MARQLNVWLDDDDHRTLEDYQHRKRLPSKTAAVRAMLAGVRSWLAKDAPPVRRRRTVREPERDDDEERDDLSDDVGPDYVPRTASGIEIEPDCPEMAALEDL